MGHRENASAPLFLLYSLITALLPGTVVAESITLLNGDRLQGQIIERNEHQLVFHHPVLGRLQIPHSQLSASDPHEPDALGLADTDATQGETAVAGSTEPTPKDPGLLGSGFLQGWTRELVGGLSGSNDASEEQTLHFEFNVRVEDRQRRWIVRNVYDRNETDSKLSKHRLYSDIKRDWLLPESPWFYFLAGRYDWDEFGDWDQRLSASGGSGYTFIDRSSLRLLGRMGLGGQRTFGGVRDQFEPELLAGVELSWKPTSAQSVQFSNSFFRNLDEAGEYRNLTTLDWVIDLDADVGLALKLGISNEHDSMEVEGGENDIDYTGSLLWKL